MQKILKSKILLSAVFALAAIAAVVVVIVVNVNQSGNDLQTQLDLGRKYVSELDYENAIIAYEKALEIDPYCFEAYFGLSEGYLALGQQDKAIEIMEQAKNMLPENVEVYINLTELYASQNQLDLAILTLENGIQATDSDRLKEMLKGYQPDEAPTEKAQPELAKGNSTADRPNEPKETSKEPSSEERREENRRPSVGIGLRQDDPQQDPEPVLIVDRDDEEPVTVPLITPMPVPAPAPTPGRELPSNQRDPIQNSSNNAGNQQDDQENDSDHGSGSIGGSQGGGSDNNSGSNVAPVLPQMGVAGNVYGIDGQGINGVTIKIYAEQSDQETPIAASTNTTGEYTQELTEGTYRIVLSKDGYVDLSTFVTVTNNVLTSYSYVMLTTSESQQAASLKGVVISATDSQNVEGATVALLPGFDKTSNGDQNVIDSSSHTTTGSDGTFAIENGVNAGYYTIEVSKDNYSTYHRNETVKPGENEFTINMSPAIEAQGTYRIVLTWGSSPRDLDSHLICTGNENYHVYYGDKDSYDNKASLDWDDTTSYGPETITVEIGQGNSYIYAVHNFTDRNAAAGEAQASNLANSGAKVAVYDSSGIIFDGNVPVGVQGTTWEVFRIENGRLIVTNNVGFDHPSNLVNDPVSTASLDETANCPEKPDSSGNQEAVAKSAIVNEANNAGSSETAEMESEETSETETWTTEIDEITSEEAPSETETEETVPEEAPSETETEETVPEEAPSETETEETVPEEAPSETETEETTPEEAPSETETASGEAPSSIPSEPQSEDVLQPEENQQSEESTASAESNGADEEVTPTEETGESAVSES